MPPWKYRRILIYFTCALAAGMIVFAAATWRSDTQVATQLIVGGVALLSITLTAYTGFATYEDTKLWKQAQDLKETIYPDTEENNEQ
jgi:hypothetical protein